jgi:hypothetical protein
VTESARTLFDLVGLTMSLRAFAVRNSRVQRLPLSSVSSVLRAGRMLQLPDEVIEAAQRRLEQESAPFTG